MLIDFRERGREEEGEGGRERERERDINVREKRYMHPNGLPLICALNGNWTRNLGMYPDQGWSPQPFGVWDDAQPTEPLSQASHVCINSSFKCRQQEKGDETKIVTANRSSVHKAHYGMCLFCSYKWSLQNWRYFAHFCLSSCFSLAYKT